MLKKFRLCGKKSSARDEDAAEEEEDASSPMHLHQLPADCLFEIYKYLNRNEILNLCTASDHLADFTIDNNILNRFLSNFTIFESHDYIWSVRPGQFVPIMHSIGPNVTYISIYMHRTGIRIPELQALCAYIIFRSCPKLVNVQLFGMRNQVQPAHGRPLLGVANPDLRVVVLTHCSFDQLDDWLHMLSNLPALEELGLHDVLCKELDATGGVICHNVMRGYRGEHNHSQCAKVREEFHRLHCTKLKVLSICCEWLQPDVFIDLLTACCETLLKLSFYFGESKYMRAADYARFYGLIGQRMPQLEKLLVLQTDVQKTTSELAAFESVWQLRQLRQLQLERLRGQPLDGLKRMITMHDSRLDHLVLVNVDLRELALLDTIGSAGNRLRVLEFRWCTAIESLLRLRWFRWMRELRELHVHSFVANENVDALLMDGLQYCPKLVSVTLMVVPQSPYMNKYSIARDLRNVVDTVRFGRGIVLYWYDGTRENIRGYTFNLEALKVYVKRSGDVSNINKHLEPIEDYIVRSRTMFRNEYVY